jgi:anti-anti-sigma factor
MADGDFSVREHNGQVVVSLRGQLDVADATSVATALAVVSAMTSHIIVDLAALDFIDSRALAALVLAAKHVKSAGGDLLLASPRQKVRRILALAGLTDVFPVYERVEDAARALGHSDSAARPAGAPTSPRLPAVWRAGRILAR